MITIKPQTLGILMITTLPAYAFNPVEGLYGGVFLGPSYTPNINVTFGPHASTLSSKSQKIVATKIKDYTANGFPVNTKGTLTYSVLGGIGGELGYRFCTNYRLEAELLYNNNPFKTLQIGNFTINSNNKSTTLHIKGDTNTGAVLINGYYDVFTPNNDGFSTVLPFVGLGIGYTYVENSLQLYYNTTNLYQFKKSHTGPAGQIIVGLSYFLDDFTWFSGDVRYFSTASYTSTNSRQNISITNKTELVSANLTFNGIFDLG